ncbi:uncharacterized protein G2W53_003493 [Senna tora]|uniref:Uncharacterized protein n=1 Tax=Senna tora TaxID=362788 RepID=A0A834XAA3_9FABA|nr:uncharacterized protein G2W53_003493 [Senna tora]
MTPGTVMRTSSEEESAADDAASFWGAESSSSGKRFSATSTEGYREEDGLEICSNFNSFNGVDLSIDSFSILLLMLLFPLRLCILYSNLSSKYSAHVLTNNAAVARRGRRRYLTLLRLASSATDRLRVLVLRALARVLCSARFSPEPCECFGIIGSGSANGYGGNAIGSAKFHGVVRIIIDLGSFGFRESAFGFRESVLGLVMAALEAWKQVAIVNLQRSCCE